MHLVDRAVMFGLASSAGVFGADMLVAMYKAAGWTHIIKWVDNFLVICLPGKSWTEDEFVQTSQAKLGYHGAEPRHALCHNVSTTLASCGT